MIYYKYSLMLKVGRFRDGEYNRMLAALDEAFGFEPIDIPSIYWEELYALLQ